MGTFLHIGSRRTSELEARQVVGRSRKCDLRLPNRKASGEHALVWWADGQWMVRDLGSTNGTWVDGQRVLAGESRSLRRNALVAFGDPDDAWRLSADHPPAPRVVDLQTNLPVDDTGPVLGLPSAEDPAVCVYWTNDGWVADQDGAITFITEGTILHVNAKRYLIHLPEQLAGTVATSEEIEMGLSRYTFFFTPLNATTVSMEAEHSGSKVNFRSRSHHLTLMTLARRRDEDARNGKPEDEAGWVDFDLLAAELDIDKNTLNVHIFRARQELARLGICGASTIVERRANSRTLRFGAANIVLFSV